MPASYKIETIFDKYKSKVYRLALSITRNPSDAEDITQNAFLKIIKNLSYFREESQISTWIYKIAYNEALMFLRKKKSQNRLSQFLNKSKQKSAYGLFVNWAKLPDQSLLDGELKERINNAIADLPIKYRMPLILDNAKDLPLKESAKVLGLKINSLKTRLHRARLIIKHDISGYFHDQEQAKAKNKRGCAILVGFMNKLVIGEMGKIKTAAFKKHIKDCRACGLFLDSYQKAIVVTKALECQDIPEKLKNKIGSFIKEERSRGEN